MKKGLLDTRRQPFFAPVRSEQQLEYPDHHDQSDNENDARGPADEFQHAVLSRFPKSVIL
jgi:hypothetical protein